MAKIRNKKTGEIREVADTELSQYGLGGVKKYPWGGFTELLGKGQGTGIMDMMNMFGGSNQNSGITAPGNLPNLEMMQKMPNPDSSQEPNKDLATSDSNPAPTKKGGTDWTQLGNQFKSMFQNQQSPNIPSFGIQGNRYFSQSGDQFGKFMEAGAESGKAFASGDYIRGAEKAAQSFAHSQLQKVNMAKGLLDWIGTEKQNSRALKREADLRRQSIFNDEENLPPIEFYGYSQSGRNNPNVMEHGGSIKTPRQFANAEFENQETFQLPNGFADSIYGNTHANGGIAVNVPNGTKVFSEALKEPMTKKSYSKLASKFKTKKDFENMEYSNADNISKTTSELSVSLKNEALDDLFKVQELNKISGKHGKKAQTAIQKDFMAKFGGLKKFDGTSGSNEFRQIHEDRQAMRDLHKSIMKPVNPYVDNPNYYVNDRFNQFRDIGFIQDPLDMYYGELNNDLAYKYSTDYAPEDKIKSTIPFTVGVNPNISFAVDSPAKQSTPNAALEYSIAARKAMQDVIRANEASQTNLTTLNSQSVSGSKNTNSTSSGWAGQKFKTPRGIITPQGTDLNKDPLSDWETWRKKYSGKDDRITKEQTREAIAALQENIYDDYLDTPEGQEALIEMWQTHGVNLGSKGFEREKYEDIAKKIKNKEKLTLDDLNRLRGNYIDSKAGKRLPKAIQSKTPEIVPPTPETKKGDNVKALEPTPFTPTPAKKSTKTGLNFYIPQPYERDPLFTKSLKPEYINPRYLDIQPELQDIERGYNALQSNLGSRTGSDIANLLQAQSNAYQAKNRARNTKYNYDRQQDSHAQQFNAQAKMNVDQINLNEFTRFNDAIARREGLLDTQKRTDWQGALQNQMEQERFAQQQAIIEDLFRPSLKDTSPATTKKKYGGKIKKKFKK